MAPDTSKCCGTDTYVDEVDGGTYCIICEAEVDPKTGHRMTERERYARFLARDES